MPPAATPIGLTEIISGIRGIVRGQRELDRFHSELKDHFGIKHCFLVSSGKAAFALTLLALKEMFPDREEVLIPAFTCYSVPSSVVRAGLRIRLCDLRLDSLDFDFAQLSTLLSRPSARRETESGRARSMNGMMSEPRRISEDPGDSLNRALAVVPTHLFGLPSDVPRLRTLIKDSGVTIVEDAAQGMGEAFQGRKLGTFGDVSFFSLARGKPFSTVEGGVILTDRDDIAEVLNRFVGLLPHYGFLSQLKVIFKAAAMMVFIHPRLFWLPKSLPFLKLGETLFEPHFAMLKMSPFQAGLAANWRRRLETLQDIRRTRVDHWIATLDASGGQGLYFSGARSRGLLRFPVRVRDRRKRESLLRESARMGMGIMPVYPTSIDAIPELRLEFSEETYPVAASCADELVTLPTHGYLTEDDVSALSELISQALGSTSESKVSFAQQP